MNINFQKTGPVTATLTVDVTADDYTAKVDEQIKHIRQTANFPGFRPGTAPKSMVTKRYGRKVMSDVINDVVYDAVSKYLQDNNIQVLGAPVPQEVQEINPEVPDYTFTYQIGLAPDIDVNLDDVTLPYYEIKVSPEMIDTQSETMRRRLGSQVKADTVDATAIVKGPLMQLTAEGNVLESDDAIQNLNAMIAVYGIRDEELKAQFVGKKIDDKVNFDPVKVANGNVAEAAAILGVDRDKMPAEGTLFQLTVAEVIVAKDAELGKEFYDEAFGPDKVHDEAEYRQALEQMIKADLSRYQMQLFEQTTQKALVDKYGPDMQLPDDILKRFFISQASTEVDPKSMDEEYPKMVPALKWQLLRDRIADKLQVKVEAADLESFAMGVMRQQFAQYGMTNLDDDTIRQAAERQLKDQQMRQRMADSVFTQKLFNAIKATAKLQVKEVTLDEFQKAANPEAAAAEAAE